MEMKIPPIPRRLRRGVVTLMAAGWVLAHAPLAAQSNGGPDPRLDGPGVGSDLTLTLDYPRLEVAENRAYIPLFFTINGTLAGSEDVKVRATFVGGTATPGEDFELGDGVRVVPAVGGLGSINWVQIPLVNLPIRS